MTVKSMIAAVVMMAGAAGAAMAQLQADKVPQVDKATLKAEQAKLKADREAAKAEKKVEHKAEKKAEKAAAAASAAVSK